MSCFSAFPLSFQLAFMAFIKATAEILNKNFRRAPNPSCYFSKFTWISYLAKTSVILLILFQDSWHCLHFQIKMLEAQWSSLGKIAAAPVHVLDWGACGCHSSGGVGCSSECFGVLSAPFLGLQRASWELFCWARGHSWLSFAKVLLVNILTQSILKSLSWSFSVGSKQNCRWCRPSEDNS